MCDTSQPCETAHKAFFNLKHNRNLSQVLSAKVIKMSARRERSHSIEKCIFCLAFRYMWKYIACMYHGVQYSRTCTYLCLYIQIFMSANRINIKHNICLILILFSTALVEVSFINQHPRGFFLLRNSYSFQILWSCGHQINSTAHPTKGLTTPSLLLKDLRIVKCCYLTVEEQLRQGPVRHS